MHMAVAVATQPPSDAARKSKTKAKERYLKRKKDRRKQRKAGAKHGGPSAVVPHPPEPNSNLNVSSDSENEAESPVSARAALRTSPPPRKRRKIDSDVDQDSEEHASDSDSNAGSSDMTSNEQEPAAKSRAQSPSAAVGLPSFPLPVAPDAPSKTTLALQGLDKALLGAEIVDPARTLSINALDAGHDLNAGDLPVISEKMKKRLQELGITEFFAGTGIVFFFASCLIFTAFQSRLLCFRFFSLRNADCVPCIVHMILRETSVRQRQREAEKLWHTWSPSSRYERYTVFLL